MRAAAALRAHLGRRGAFLLIIGAGKVCWGASFLASPTEMPGLRPLTQHCSIGCWAWLWIVCGAAAICSAFVRVGRDWLGFMAALLPPMVWATTYAVAALSGDYSRGGWVAVWYLTSHVGVIMWASAVPEFEVPPPPRPAQEGET